MYRRCSLGVALKDSLDEFILVRWILRGLQTESTAQEVEGPWRAQKRGGGVAFLGLPVHSPVVVMVVLPNLRQSQQIHPELAQKTLAQFDTSITQLYVFLCPSPEPVALIPVCCVRALLPSNPCPSG